MTLNLDPNTIHQCDPNEITVLENRQRKNMDINELRQLEESISRLGQLQPAVCRREGTELLLVAGERRLKACKSLGIPYSYILLSEISDPVLLEEMELHENIRREELSFKDRAAAHARLHALYEKTRGTQKIKGKPSWSIEKTGKEIGVSATVLRDDIELHQFAERVPAVAAAKNRTEAKSIIKRLKNQVLQDEALRQLKNPSTQLSPEKKSANSGTTGGTEMTNGSPINSQEDDILSAAVRNFSSHIHCGDFREILKTKFPETLFDLVFFDPPWGVNFEEVFQLSGSQKGYSDNRKDFFRNLNSWLSTLYSHMNKDSFLFLKFGITSHFYVVRALMRAGFTTDGIPLIWHKPNIHRTRSPKYTWGRCYEPILLARKGNKELSLQGKPNLIQAPSLPSSLKDIHPSAMHPKVIRELLSRSAFPGDKFLDPMAGSGMSGVAAESLRDKLGLDYTLIDKDKNFCNLMIKNLLKGYSVINSDTPQEEEAPTSFRELEPGSAEWMTYWSEHPDEQDDMVAFAKGDL